MDDLYAQKLQELSNSVSALHHKVTLLRQQADVSQAISYDSTAPIFKPPPTIWDAATELYFCSSCGAHGHDEAHCYAFQTYSNTRPYFCPPQSFQEGKFTQRFSNFCGSRDHVDEQCLSHQDTSFSSSYHFPIASTPQSLPHDESQTFSRSSYHSANYAAFYELGKALVEQLTQNAAQHDDACAPNAHEIANSPCSESDVFQNAPVEPTAPAVCSSQSVGNSTKECLPSPLLDVQARPSEAATVKTLISRSKETLPMDNCSGSLQAHCSQCDTGGEHTQSTHLPFLASLFLTIFVFRRWFPAFVGTHARLQFLGRLFPPFRISARVVWDPGGPTSGLFRLVSIPFCRRLVSAP